MYTIPSAGGVVPGAILATTGGTLTAVVIGLTIAVLSITLGIMLAVRERRRQQELEVAPSER
ncbi:hypothetical protein [Microbacterium sp. TPU 3598]|uniref:hypothetical protein n=1 Tax=Microbacterium sp. TPU 3598 TaxID=1938334 RepID=UPI0012FE0C53|nr:hypothetical protein [Microbacterium sp. TPU 3598]